MLHCLRCVAPILAMCLVSSTSHSQAPPTYAIPAHVIGGGTHTMANACFRLGATLGDAAPGYSSAAGYALLSGFQAAAPVPSDTIFSSGFQEC